MQFAAVKTARLEDEIWQRATVVQLPIGFPRYPSQDSQGFSYKGVHEA